MLKKAALAATIALLSCICFAEQDSVQSNLQEAIVARYRLTQIGYGKLGLTGSEDTIRRIGGTLLVVKKGLYGTQSRPNITSNSIKNGERTLLSGNEDVALLPGERFFANSVVVGPDFVNVGLISVDPRNFQGHMGRVWSSVTFFFDKQVISGGDLNNINATMDQWILPGDTLSNAPPTAVLASRVTTQPMAPSIELKPGASREAIETGLGKPMQAISFENKLWLTYPGLVAVLEEGKLASVERNEQAYGNLSLNADKGTEIYIDGELAGTTPTTLRIPTGSHKVELKVAGKSVWEQQVRVFPGADVNLKPTTTANGQ